MPLSHQAGWPDLHGPQAPQLSSGNTASRSPLRTVVTPEPTSTTSPEYSWPSTAPAGTPKIGSSEMCRSDPQMPHSPTLTTTSPGPGVGSGRLSITSGLWTPWKMAAFMTVCSPEC